LQIVISEDNLIVVALRAALADATKELTMAFVVVNLASEYLPDGSFHVYSPDVPGFHVVNQDRKRSQEQIFFETALPILRDTMAQRVFEAKVGEAVTIKDMPITTIESFVPHELARRLRRDAKPGIPTQVLAEIT
jgi:hypothetical protein